MQAHCLCRAVRLTAPDHTQVGVCHCGMCRRWGGGPYFGIHCGPQVRIEGEEHVSRYRSSDWAERGFCKHCGTHLFYHLLPADDHIVPAGLFQDAANLTLAHQIYIDHKPGYYGLTPDTPTMTEQDVIAQFTPSQS